MADRRRTPLPRPEPGKPTDAYLLTLWQVIKELQAECQELQDRVYELENP